VIAEFCTIARSLQRLAFTAVFVWIHHIPYPASQAVAYSCENRCKRRLILGTLRLLGGGYRHHLQNFFSLKRFYKESMKQFLDFML
jgi:hypothetical protein